MEAHKNMDSFFKNNFEYKEIKIFKKKCKSEKRYLETDIFYKNSNGLVEDNKNSDFEENIYRSIFFLRRIFLSLNEKCLLKSISFINKGKFDEALNVLNNYNKDGKYIIDINFLQILLNPETPDYKDLLNKIITDINSLGNFFKKFNLGIYLLMSLSDHIFIEIKNSRTAMLLYLVLYQAKHGNNSNALSLLLKIKEENDRKNPLIELLLGELYIRTEQYDQAIILLQNIDGSNIICIYSLLLLGKAFRKNGLLKSSISVLRKIRRRSNRYPQNLNLEGRYQLAISLERYNKEFLAKKEYEKILTTDYNYKDAKKRLYSLQNI